jgi:hypothetical protein
MAGLFQQTPLAFEYDVFATGLAIPVVNEYDFHNERTILFPLKQVMLLAAAVFACRMSDPTQGVNGKTVRRNHVREQR